MSDLFKNHTFGFSTRRLKYYNKQYHRRSGNFILTRLADPVWSWWIKLSDGLLNSKPYSVTTWLLLHGTSETYMSFCNVPSGFVIHKGSVDTFNAFFVMT